MGLRSSYPITIDANWAVTFRPRRRRPVPGRLRRDGHRLDPPRPRGGHWLEPSALGEREVAINEWSAERRTDSLGRLAHIGSVPSDTITVLGVMALLVIIFPLAVRRWRGWAFLVGALAMEAAVCQTSNLILA